MVNGLVPPYLSAIVPCNFENIHDYQGPLDDNYRWANLLHFLGIDDGLESYMQFVISCEGFVQFEFLSNNNINSTIREIGVSNQLIFL
jgi:hypothetical protein